MKVKLIHSLGSFFGLLLFLVALWILHHELKAYHFHDIVQHLGEIPTHRLFLALVLTFMSYLMMTSYDTLALRHIQHPLSYSKIALASFIGYRILVQNGFISKNLSGGFRTYIGTKQKVMKESPRTKLWMGE